MTEALGGESTVWTVDVCDDVAAFLSDIEAARVAQPGAHANLRYFSHPAWVRTVWSERELKRGSRFVGLMARGQTGEVSGWWPLVLSKRSFGWRLQNLGQEICDYAEPHVAVGVDVPSLVSAMISAIETLARRFTFAQLANFQPAGHLALTDSPVAEELGKLARGWLVGPQRDDLRLDARKFGNDWQRFLSERISARQRKNMRHEWNVLTRRGVITIDRPDRNTLAALKPAYLDWYRYGQNDEARRQKLDIWWSVFLSVEDEVIAPSVLRIDGEPASIIVAFRRGEELDLFSLVFDPRFAADSVGKLHLQRFIRSWMEDGGSQFNFLVGSEDYKAHLATDTTHVRTLYYYHRRNIPALLRSLRPRGKPLAMVITDGRAVDQAEPDNRER